MKANKIQFSVLMSVYKNDNSENFRSAVNSIIHQTVKPNEIVIMVDGPVGLELRKTIDEFERLKFVKIIRFKENGGLGHALKVGVMHCNYPYIARMDSDDISLPNRFELQIKHLINNPNIDVLGGAIAEYDETMKNFLSIRKMPNDYKIIYKTMKKRNSLNHMTVFFKKAAVLKVGNYQECPNFEDYFLWCKMLKNKCKIENLNNVLVNVRGGKDMFSRRGGKKYCKSIINFEYMAYRINFLNVYNLFFNTLIRVSISIVSNNLRIKIYKKFLRN